MLSISSKSLYAISALFELASNNGQGALTIAEIAKRQKIPEDYLRQVMVVLKRATLTSSIRGNDGGYILARSPENITIREVVESLEGPIRLINQKSKEKVVNGFFETVSTQVGDILDKTLAELIKEKKKIEKTPNFQI